MPHYCVTLNGQNFWLELQGDRRRMGFYTRRFVEATDPQAAELAAIEQLRTEGKLKPLNDRSDSPRVFVEALQEVAAADVPAVVEGFAFYPDEPEADA
jgi:hypothetical protein